MIKQTIDLNHLISNRIINLHHYVTIPLTCKVKQTTEVGRKATKALSSIAATVSVFPLSNNDKKNAVKGFTKQKVSDAWSHHTLVISWTRIHYYQVLPHGTTR